MATTQEKAPQESNGAEPEVSEFRQQQVADAASQNMTQENAVPEQRPQAFLETPVKESELSRKLREESEESNKPMDEDAFKRASSKGQMKKAAENSTSEGIMVGAAVRANAGPHEDRIFAVTRVTGRKPSDMVLQAVGSPDQRFLQPTGLELRAIGDERDGEIVVLEGDDLDDAELEKLDEGWRGTRAGRRH